MEPRNGGPAQGDLIRKLYTPFAHIFIDMSQHMFDGLSRMLQNEPQPDTQINAVPSAGYGAVEHVSNNPFAFAGGTIVEEPVQPSADAGPESFQGNNPYKSNY